MKSVVVSIGMPVRNEERFLSQALDSLLSQDFTDFEIIISDNASTDRTQQIALEYKIKDTRIRYVCNEKNIGFTRNVNQLFKLSSGKYFMWASGHDLWDKHHLFLCVDFLEKKQNVVLAHGLTSLIDVNNNILSTKKISLDTSDLGIISRFSKFILSANDCTIIHGLMRIDAINKTNLLKNVLGADILFLSELSLLGDFAQIPKILYYSRQIRPQETPIKAAKRRIDDLCSPQSRYYPRVFYLIHLMQQYIKMIIGKPLKFYYKIILIFFVFYDLSILYVKTMLKYFK